MEQLTEKIKSDRRYKIALVILVFCIIYFFVTVLAGKSNDIITGAAVGYVSSVIGFYFSASDDKKEEKIE